MKNTFNWAILGAGRIAGKFAGDLKLMPNTHLYAVGSRSQERAEAFATQFGVEKAYGSYEALVQDKAIDAIYIATRHIYHRDNTLLCLDHGIPTLCEKPFAINQQQVKSMIDRATEKQVFLMEAMWSRFLPTTKKILEIINSGMIGKINYISADFGFKADYNPEKRLFNHQLAGGSILDIGIYPIFLAYLILGIPNEITATAKIGETKVDEQCSMLFEYPDGVIANLHSTFLSTTPCTAHIYGDSGTINIHRRWHEARSFDVVYYDGRKEFYEFPREARGYFFEIEELMECVKHDKQQSNLWSHTDSLNLIHLLDAVRNKIDLRYDFE